MPEQIITKTCRICNQTKSLSEFHKNSDHHDKHLNTCKICQCAYQKHYRQTEKGKAYQKCYQQKYRQGEKGKTARKRYNQSEKGRKVKSIAVKCYNIRHPEQFKAKHAVNNAIRDGRLPRPDSLKCHYCPAQAKEYHHHKGYEPKHWLDVVPVCGKCHYLLPRLQRRQIVEEP